MLLVGMAWVGGQVRGDLQVHDKSWGGGRFQVWHGKARMCRSNPLALIITAFEQSAS